MAVQKLFGTSGIRGEAINLFTKQFCFDIGRAFNTFLEKRNIKNKIIAFAMDPRPSSPQIKKSVMAGIQLSWEILDEGILPTPALNYFTKIYNCGGIMVTGSHIAEKLNGLKFFIQDHEILNKEIKTLEKIYSQQDKKNYLPTDKIPQTEETAKKLYFKMLFELADGDMSNFKIILDASNGTQSEIIFKLLVSLGIKAKKINCSLGQPIFYRDTDTQDPFPELRYKVVSEKADLGVGFDIDGDRVIFIDEKGNSLPGELPAAIIAKFNKGDLIVTPISSSLIVDHLDKRVIRTKVGIPNVVEAMKKHGSLIGFEPNGGYISGELFYDKDGGVPLIKMLNIMKKTSLKLSALTKQLPKYFIFKHKIDCPREKNEEILEAVRKKYLRNKIEDIDGLKIWLDKNTWILFRPSGNAPEFRVIAESKTDKKARKLAQDGINFVKMIIEKKYANL